jgi:D-lactate dehydrogenase (cytochrome)
MDLIDLFIGSEGIFGVFTEVEVRLEDRCDIVSDIAFFTDPGDALAYVNQTRVLGDRGLLSLEYFDANSLGFMRSEYPEIKGDINAAVFTEFRRDQQLLTEISESQAGHNAREDWCALTSADARDLKELRHALPDGINTYLREHESYKLGTDFVVPGERFGEMLESYERAGQEFEHRFRRGGMHHVLFGHIGDHHLHFNFITHNDEERQAAKKMYAELAIKAVELGGTISGEHGVGKKTISHGGREIPYLQLMYGEAGLREIASIKKVLDPNGLLNVGNMIPMEYLL